MLIDRTIDELMHLLIIRKHGEGVVDIDNKYHWLSYLPDVKPGIICLYCGANLYDLVIEASVHALGHIKEHNLTAFL